MQYVEGLFDPLLVSDQIARVTSFDNWVQKMVDVECAIAQAQAEIGIIPRDAALEISGLSQHHKLNATELGNATRESGTPVVPLVRQLTEKLSDVAKPWIHYGATSQDILDSATMIIIAESLQVIFSDLGDLCLKLSQLCDEHRNTLMVSRTLMQHALPTTFGLKAAIWLGSVMDAGQVLSNIYRERLAIQFGGAGGTLASLGDDGIEVASRVAELLSLTMPTLPWQAERNRIVELASGLSTLTGSLGKIATDVALGSQAEIAEISESLGSGGGSSAMPQKVNPVGAIAINAGFRRAQGLASVAMGCMIVENERGAGEWQAEWQTIRELIQLTGGAVQRTNQLIQNLHVNEVKMLQNLELSRGNILSEKILLRLSETLGRSKAYDLVKAASKRSSISNTTLKDELLKESIFNSSFNTEEIKDIFEPRNYLGSTFQFIDRVINRWNQISISWEAIALKKDRDL